LFEVFMPMRRIADRILESASDYAIITTDLKGTITYWNKGAEQVLGWTEQEALGQSASLIFTPEDQRSKIPEAELGEALSKGQAADERWHMRKDGSRVWASSELLLLQDGPAPDGFLKILRDRTADRLAKEQLEESQARLALATEAGEIGIWDWDVCTGAMTYSERAKALCGFPRDHVITIEEARRVVHPEDLPRTSAMSKRALDPVIRERVPYEYRIIRPDGEIRWLLAHGEAVFGPGPNGERAVRYIGTLQDITDRMLLQQQVQQSQSRLTLAVTAGKMAVWELEVATEQVTSSPELNKLLGFPHDAQPTMEEIRSRYYPGERERMREVALAALQNGERFVEFEYRCIWQDQSVHWLMVRAEFLLDAQGSPFRLIGVVMDIDARKQAQELQSVLNQELSHRLKNQLALVQGIVTQSLRKATDLSTARDTIVQRLVVLAQAHDLVVSGLSERAVLHDVIAKTVHLHDDGNAGRFELAGPDLEVGPRAALSLSLVLHELATNAVKYGSLSANGGKVTISWGLAGASDEFFLNWREMNGPTVVEPHSPGFGTRLIRSGIAGESSQVDINFAPSGLICTLRVALADLQAAT
jgi:PAS domain S-box-containing protein